jgi:hypothetical protein
VADAPPLLDAQEDLEVVELLVHHLQELLELRDKDMLVEMDILVHIFQTDMLLVVAVVQVVQVILEELLVEALEEMV